MGTRDLSGKVALVTGSSSGIGEATARALDALGATVVINSSSTVEAGEAVAASLRDATYVQSAVGTEPEAARLIAMVLERHGRLDVLVNNAGTTTVIPHTDIDAAGLDIWRRIFETNVIGTWQLTVAAVPHLRSSGQGQVVIIRTPVAVFHWVVAARQIREGGNSRCSLAPVAHACHDRPRGNAAAARQGACPETAHPQVSPLAARLTPVATATPAPGRGPQRRRHYCMYVVRAGTGALR